MRRGLVVTVVLVTAVLAAVAGWVAATVIQGPADLSEGASMEPSLVTAEVEERVLSSQVIARGTVGYGQPIEVIFPPGGPAGFVTVPPEEGLSLSEGDVVMQVSGRPVVVLEGVVPMYREMRVGTSGDDVAQLQEALDRMEYDISADDAGVFGSATLDAVTTWFDDLGYELVDESVSRQEILFLPKLEVRVSEVFAGRAASAEGPLFSVTESVLSVASSLDRSDRELVSEGDAAAVVLDDLGIEVEGSVGALADQAGTMGLDEQRYFMEITLPADAPSELVDASVRIDIPVESTDGEVLVVPVAALVTASDGSVRVEVAASEGDTRLVTVTTGLSAGGLVEVTPQNGDLTKDDRVVVGTDPSGGSR